MGTNIKASYTAASVFPAKLLKQEELLGKAKNGYLPPLHAQIIPTNVCNLDCSFCSYDDRQKGLSMNYDTLTGVIDTLAKYGGKAVTWTGGGEPLLYPEINNALRYAASQGIESGLVSNGTRMDWLEKQDALTWVRISISDDRQLDFDSIERAVRRNPDTDWAFSYVLTASPSYANLNQVINFANEHDFTHVRVVSDLLDLGRVPNMQDVKQSVIFDDSKVIYQGRKEYTSGAKDCHISLLKPMISPEGVFPCCGTVYAIAGQEKKHVDEMKMGELSELENIIKEQKRFDGSICDKCYYDDYNGALGLIMDEVEHENFV